MIPAFCVATVPLTRAFSCCALAVYRAMTGERTVLLDRPRLRSLCASMAPALRRFWSMSIFSARPYWFHRPMAAA